MSSLTGIWEYPCGDGLCYPAQQQYFETQKQWLVVKAKMEKRELRLI